MKLLLMVLRTLAMYKQSSNNVDSWSNDHTCTMGHAEGREKSVKDPLTGKAE